MDNTGNGGTTAIVDISHSAGDGTRGGNTAEERRSQVGHALGYQFGIRRMASADDTIGHRCRQQRLYSTEDSNGDGRRNQSLDDFPRQHGHLRLGQHVGDREAVANGLNSCHAGILLQQQGSNGHDDNGNERTREFAQCRAAGQLRPQGDECHRANAHTGTPPVDGRQRPDVGYPFFNEVAGYVLHRQAQQVLNLSGKNRQRNTARETDDNGIRDVLDDCSQVQHAKHDEEHTSHQRGNGQPLEAVLLDNTINNNNERARRTTNLHLGATKDGYKESSNDGGDNTLLGRHARSDTECNSQRQCDNTYNDSGQQVGGELLLRVVLERREKLRLKL